MQRGPQIGRRTRAGSSARRSAGRLLIPLERLQGQRRDEDGDKRCG